MEGFFQVSKVPFFPSLFLLPLGLASLGHILICLDKIMKQAFTNTIRNGGGKPLTIATGSKKASSRAKGKQQVPKCAYGSACNRKGCAFRHPPAGTSYQSYYEDPKSKICLPYIAGICTYGGKWWVP